MAAIQGQSAGGNITNNGNTRIYINTAHSNARPTKLHLFPECSIYFHGREGIISKLQNAVQDSKTQTHSFLRTIVLHGSGGMGKSETARAFATRYHSDYDYIIWFDAQTELSLNSSFKKLAKKLEIPFETVNDVPNIYEKLVKTYNTGIFIFDNAEGLKTRNKQLGIENYLHKTDFLPNKPIYLVTSRNGLASWGGRGAKVKIIPIDHLSYDETCQCVKKYLQIEDQDVSAALQDSISSIATTLNGYPLALSLVWAMVEGLEENISFHDIESRIKLFTTNIYTECDDEAKLNLILSAAVTSVGKDRNGSVALELLGIMANLSPIGLELKLVYAIYSCQCYSGRMSLEIEDKDFINGIKLLQNYSLVGKHGEEVKIHRLIQQFIKKSATMEPLTKILRFFQQNPHNLQWGEHMTFVLDALVEVNYVENTTFYLCMMTWKLITVDLLNYLDLNVATLKKCFKNATPDEQFMMKLAEFYVGLRLKHKFTPFKISTSVDLKTGFLSLTKGFLSHGWVIQSCVYFVWELLSSDSFLIKIKLNPSSRAAISDWIVFNYINLLTAQQTEQTITFNGVLEVLYSFESTRLVRDDAEFILNWINSPSSRIRNSFWSHTWHLLRFGDFRLEILSVYGVDLFTQYLQVENKCGQPMSYYFLVSLKRAVKNDGNAKKFAASSEFLNLFSEAFQWFAISKFTFLDVAFIWLTLFAQDMEVYNTFKVHLETKFEQFCNSDELLWMRRFGVGFIEQTLNHFTKKLNEKGCQVQWVDRLLAVISLQR